MFVLWNDHQFHSNHRNVIFLGLKGNKTVTSQVGAIPKAQKFSRYLLNLSVRTEAKVSFLQKSATGHPFGLFPHVDHCRVYFTAKASPVIVPRFVKRLACCRGKIILRSVLCTRYHTTNCMMVRFAEAPNNRVPVVLYNLWTVATFNLLSRQQL